VSPLGFWDLNHWNSRTAHLNNWLAFTILSLWIFFLKDKFCGEKRKEMSQVESQVYYIVTATINTDVETNLQRYVDWLKGGHVQAVVATGALSGDVVVLDPAEPGAPSTEVQSVYVFPSRSVLQAYFDGPAQELRKEGKELWIDTGIVSFRRSIGNAVFRTN
jgi:hypothetical protein